MKQISRERIYQAVAIITIIAILATLFVRLNTPEVTGVVAYSNKGTFTSGTGAISVPAPTGFASGTLMILAVESENEDIATPSGWTAVSGSPQATGTAAAAGSVRVEAFYRFATTSASFPNAEVADSGDHTAGIMFSFTGVDVSSPFDGYNGSVDSGATASLSCPEATTTVANAMILNIIGLDKDLADTDTLSSTRNAKLGNVTERHDQTISSADGGGIALITSNQVAAGATGNTTATGDTSTTHAYITISLKPNNSPAVTLTTPADGGSVSSLTPDLTWSGTDAESDYITYNLMLNSTTSFPTALKTNGTDNYVSLGTMGTFGSAIDDPTGGFYISFKMNSTSTTIGRWGAFNTSGTAWQILFNSDQDENQVAGKVCFFMRGADAAKIEGATTATTTFNDGNTHTIVITASTTARTLTISIDGDSKAITYSGQSVQAAYADFNNGVYLGARSAGTGVPSNYFAATFDDVSIGTTASSLYGIYTFNEGTGNSTSDTSGYGNTGYLYGTPLWVNDLTSPVTTNVVSGVDAGFSGSSPYASGTAVTYTVQSALTNGSTYYWKVRGIDSASASSSNIYSAWSSTYSFTVNTSTSSTTSVFPEIIFFN